MLTPDTLRAYQQAIADAGLDGWLLFDFRGCNPIAVGIIGARGLLTRRIFVWVPRVGVPVAVTHQIEQAPWAHARAVIEARGFGAQFPHRTGHSIDAHELHGAGPHLDNLETREERVLIPGVGFSIEPGVYLTGEIGMRSEVNAWVGDGVVVVTPSVYQRDLLAV